MQSFAERLKEAREMRGYTQEQLSGASGVSLSSVRRYVHNKRGKGEPSAFYLLALAQVLDVTPEYLLIGDNNMNKYTAAIKAELSQITDFHSIEEIKSTPLNASVLAHLEMSDDLVNDILQTWEGKNLLKDSGFYRSYIRDVILRYCQNRSFLKSKLNLSDGMICGSVNNT